MTSDPLIFYTPVNTFLSFIFSHLTHLTHFARCTHFARMDYSHLPLNTPSPRTGFYRGYPYERVSTHPPPPQTGSLTPHSDAVSALNFSYYPQNIYDKEAIYIPKFQPSLVWKIVRPIVPPGQSGPAGGPPADPAVFDMKAGGQLPPWSGSYVPPTFAPGPLGAHPGLSYVQCDHHRNAVAQPKNMAPAHYYP